MFRNTVRGIRKVSAVTKTYTESQQTYHGVVLQQLLITMAALCLYGVQLVPYTLLLAAAVLFELLLAAAADFELLIRINFYNY